MDTVDNPTQTGLESFGAGPQHLENPHPRLGHSLPIGWLSLAQVEKAAF
jgi:hypothetical protein